MKEQGQVTTPTREELEALSAQLQAVWHNPNADMRMRKRIVRTLIREIVVDVDSTAGRVVLVIHWKGGVHTELRLPPRRRSQNSGPTSPEIVDAVRVLAQTCTDDVIAGVLNRHGLLTGRRRNRWTALRSYHVIPCYSNDRQTAEGWLNLTEAARVLKVDPKTLRLAAERGEIEAQHPLREGPWVFNRRVLESAGAARFLERVAKRGPAIPTDG